MKTENIHQKQAVELFHLIFLEHFSRAIDKQLYALKEGCNLRFFFNSIRYSEDMDLDIKTIGKSTLQNKVQKLLQSTPLKNALQLHGITIDGVSAPKQTETTQRWKIQLLTQNTITLINTKIEFSRRDEVSGVQFDFVNKSVLSEYKLLPYLASHYPANLAYEQKIVALANRVETQARDIFDLFLLESMLGNEVISVELSLIDNAKENLFGVEYDEFQSQVVAYLYPSYQANYTDRSVWEQIQLSVFQRLECLSEND